MDSALILAAVMLGLAGAPHCAAMCGAPCAAVVSGCAGARGDTRVSSLAFHVARALAYAAVGGLAAAGVGVLSAAGSAAPLLRPVWTLLHMAALALGLWLLCTARQPAFMSRVGRSRRVPAVAATGGWQTMAGPLTAASAGAAWVAWPCGLLQSALVLAALATTPQGGASAMAGFALASAAGLQLTPWIGSRLGARNGAARTRWAVRIAGLALALGSGWALGHDVWVKVAAYCST